MSYGARLNPWTVMESPEALNTAGITSFEAGDVEAAAEKFERALVLNPEFRTARMNLAACHVRAGRLADAKAEFERAAACQPASPEAFRELGALCLHLKDFAGAERAFEQARSLDPDDIAALGNLCLALLAQGKYEAALGHLAVSEALVAGNASLQTLAAAAAEKSGDAAAALGYYRKLLAASPANRTALRGLLTSPDADESAAAHAALLGLLRGGEKDPESWRALANLAHNERGYEAGRDILDEGIAHTGDAGLLMVRAMLLPKVPLSHAQIEDSRAEMHKTLDRVLAGDYRVDKPTKSLDKMPFHLAYHGRNDKELQEKIARAHLAVAPHLAWTAPQLGRKKRQTGRLRLGFISVHLKNHSVGRMFGGFVEKLDPRRFEKIIIRPVGGTDQFAERLDRSADQSITLSVDLATARQTIADLELDVLFYADIGMDPFTYYLAFSRLAPVQMNWPGHPLTSGISTIDHFVTSSLIEADDCRDHYSEKPVLLGHVPTYFTRESMDLGEVDRAALGLPRDARLYVCPMTIYKFHPDFDKLVAGILDRDRDGRLVIVSRDTFWYRALIGRMAQSVPDSAQRLITLSWLTKKPFLSLLKTADVILDTVHVGGANTSLDAFSYGTPIVTPNDRFLRGRFTSSMYRQMGYTDLIAGTEEAYIDLAVRLANDRAFRRAASQTILSQNGVLYSDQGVVDERGERILALAAARRTDFL